MSATPAEARARGFERWGRFIARDAKAVIGLPLDISTMMIGAILLGVAVDDTIQFMHVFYRYYGATGDPTGATGQTLQTTGRALLFTSIVLAAGFFILTLATVDNVSHTGALIGFAVAVAFFADVLLAPALLVTMEPRRPQ